MPQHTSFSPLSCAFSSTVEEGERAEGALQLATGISHVGSMFLQDPDYFIARK